MIECCAKLMMKVGVENIDSEENSYYNLVRDLGLWVNGFKFKSVSAATTCSYIDNNCFPLLIMLDRLLLLLLLLLLSFTFIFVDKKRWCMTIQVL